MRPPAVEELIKQFCRFPAIGPRTAGRFVFYLINAGKKDLDEFIDSLRKVKEQIKTCSFCFYPFQGEEASCSICNNASRDRGQLCIVEKETDLESVEKIGIYRGLYFVLGGIVSSLKKDLNENIRIKELAARIKDYPFPLREIIIATNPNTEGEMTARYLEELLRDSGIPTTRLARGLPIGGELEYADEETLMIALKNRK